MSSGPSFWTVTDAKTKRTVHVEKHGSVFHVRKDYGRGFDDSAVQVITESEARSMTKDYPALEYSKRPEFCIGSEVLISERAA